MDIDSCAGANAPDWAGRADDVCSQDPRIAEFRALCTDSLVGTNVIASKLLHFFRSGEVVSTYAFVAATRGSAEAAKEYDDAFGRNRLAFETSIGAHHIAIYGTLDLVDACGGRQYGPFRLVSDPGSDVERPVVLPHNSATGYVQSGVVDETSLCTDAATWEARASVATVRRGERVCTSSREDWPDILATEDEPPGAIAHDLVEVVLRDGPRPIATVQSVRISRERYNAMNDEYGRELLRPAHQRPELVAAYGELTALVDAGELQLEIVG